MQKGKFVSRNCVMALTENDLLPGIEDLFVCGYANISKIQVFHIKVVQPWNNTYFMFKYIDICTSGKRK